MPSVSPSRGPQRHRIRPRTGVDGLYCVCRAASVSLSLSPSDVQRCVRLAPSPNTVQGQSSSSIFPKRGPCTPVDSVSLPSLDGGACGGVCCPGGCVLHRHREQGQSKILHYGLWRSALSIRRRPTCPKLATIHYGALRSMLYHSSNIITDLIITSPLRHQSVGGLMGSRSIRRFLAVACHVGGKQGWFRQRSTAAPQARFRCRVFGEPMAVESTRGGWPQHWDFQFQCHGTISHRPAVHISNLFFPGLGTVQASSRVFPLLAPTRLVP